VIVLAREAADLLRGHDSAAVRERVTDPTVTVGFEVLADRRDRHDDFAIASLCDRRIVELGPCQTDLPAPFAEGEAAGPTITM